MSDSVRMRPDVWKLAAWDPILEWYAKAVAEMQRRPIADPTSWRYQAAIHEYVRRFDPLASDADSLPSTADQQKFWTQCQHGTWFFLPWHRMYLGYFEQIVASTIVGLGGPDDWALPYWNYSDPNNPDARRLPAAFRDARTPEGLPNPLRITARNTASNNGDVIAGDDDVALTEALIDPDFAGTAAGGNPAFGGPKTGFQHSGGTPGKLERVPHGSMHGQVGGWMGRFNTAALDPIFWLHHANIDRLWAVWRARNTKHLDPKVDAWLKDVVFAFHDASGNVVSHRCEEVVDTTQPPLRYRYEDVSDPLAGAVPAAAEIPPRRSEVEDQVIPEMVGATEEPITLIGRPVTAHLAISAPIGPALATAEATSRPRPVYLNFENITGSGAPTSHSVYINVPEGEDPWEHPELFAGILPMFGVAEATREDAEHAGSGLHYVLEVGDVARTLEARNAWDPDDVRVTFVPRGVGAEPERAAARAAAAEEGTVDPIQVGRVSVYLG